MRTKIQARILSCMFSSSASGFTLLEVLTVIIIGGILASISMPYFFSRAVAAKQAEGKMLVSTITRSQQAYFTLNGRFSDSLEALALSLGSRNYDLLIQSESGGGSAANFATSKQSTVRSYVGLTAVVQDAGGNVGMQTILCEAEVPGTTQAATPTYNASSIDCASGTRKLN